MSDTAGNFLLDREGGSLQRFAFEGSGADGVVSSMITKGLIQNRPTATIVLDWGHPINYVDIMGETALLRDAKTAFPLADLHGGHGRPFRTQRNSPATARIVQWPVPVIQPLPR